MVSKIKRPEHREQRFSFRKFSFGAASVLVGSLLFLGGGQVAADEVVTASDLVIEEVATTPKEEVSTEEATTETPVVSVETPKESTEVAEETVAEPALTSAVTPKPSEASTELTTSPVVTPAETTTPAAESQPVEAPTTTTNATSEAKPTEATAEEMVLPTGPSDSDDIPTRSGRSTGVRLTPGAGFRIAEDTTTLRETNPLPEGYAFTAGDLPTHLAFAKATKANRLVYAIVQTNDADLYQVVEVDVTTGRNYIRHIKKDGTNVIPEVEATTTAAPVSVTGTQYRYEVDASKTRPIVTFVGTDSQRNRVQSLYINGEIDNGGTWVYTRRNQGSDKIWIQVDHVRLADGRYMKDVTGNANYKNTANNKYAGMKYITAPYDIANYDVVEPYNADGTVNTSAFSKTDTITSTLTSVAIPGKSYTVTTTVVDREKGLVKMSAVDQDGAKVPLVIKVRDSVVFPGTEIYRRMTDEDVRRLNAESNARGEGNVFIDKYTAIVKTPDSSTIK